MNGDVLSIAGALIIFFNWLVTNTRLERVKSAKAALAASETQHQLVSLLNEVRSTQDSLASAIHRLGGEFVRAGVIESTSANAGSRTLMEQRERFAEARLSARQIAHARDWAATDMSHYSDSAPHEVKMLLVDGPDGLNHLIKEIEARFDQADQHLKGKGVLAPSDLQALDGIYAYYSETLLPRFKELMNKVIEASKQGREALREATEKAQQRVKITRWFTIGLYVVGTIMALAGAAVKGHLI